jgi:hypothetical protein
MALLSGVRCPHPFGLVEAYTLFRDVGYESYKAHRRGPTPFEAAHFSEPTRVGLVAVKRTAFQTVASM